MAVLQPPPIITIYSRDPRDIALTYDDGPNDQFTPRLLELLAKHRVKATFFLIGEHVRRWPDIVREISKSGHTIGNHSDTHPDLSKLSAQQGSKSVEAELSACRKSIEDVLGSSGQWFRPPYGAASPEVSLVAQRMGLKTTNWSADGNDWDEPTPIPQVIAGKISAFIDSNQVGRIVLLHDGSPTLDKDCSNSVEATRLLLEKYRNKRFVSL